MMISEIHCGMTIIGMSCRGYALSNPHLSDRIIMSPAQDSRRVSGE